MFAAKAHNQNLEKNKLKALDKNNQETNFFANRREIFKIATPGRISFSLLHWTQRHQKLSQSKVQPRVNVVSDVKLNKTSLTTNQLIGP